jgi:hypothetical protein
MSCARFSSRSAAALLIAALAGGCLPTWSDASRATGAGRWNRFKPPAPPALTPETVILQYIKIEREIGNVGLDDTIWREGDDQFLPPNLRAELSRNGIRCARFGGELGSEMLALLENSNERNEGRSHQLVAGTMVKMQLTEPLPRVQLFSFSSGSPKGETLENAQGFLHVTPTLAAGGKILLAMTPQIDYGERMRTPAVAQNLTGLELKTERPCRAFNELRIETAVSSGDFLLFGCIADRAGTFGGDCFLREKDGKKLQAVLLVRALRPKREDLFQAGFETNDFFLSPNSSKVAPASAARRTIAAARRGG